MRIIDNAEKSLAGSIVRSFSRQRVTKPLLNGLPGLLYLRPKSENNNNSVKGNNPAITVMKL